MGFARSECPPLEKCVGFMFSREQLNLKSTADENQVLVYEYFGEDFSLSCHLGLFVSRNRYILLGVVALLFAAWKL